MLDVKEDAMLKPSENYQVRHLDFQEGDIVQVKRNDKYSGRIGKIIGVSLHPRKQCFLYTIKFSDKESVTMLAYFLNFISREDQQTK